MNINELHPIKNAKHHMYHLVGTSKFGHGVYDGGGVWARKAYVMISRGLDRLDFGLFVPLYSYTKESL